MPTISARLPEEEQADLDAVAKLLSEDRSTTIRKALRKGLGELREQVAAERYQSGEISALEAAELADCSVAEWLEVARKRNLTTQLSPEDLERDADVAGEL